MKNRDSHWIACTPDDQVAALRLAEARLSDGARHLSPHRATSRNLPAQLRGALGEVVAVRWLRSTGFMVERGFESDEIWCTDLIADGVRIEVMTAQVAHRAITGFCVPPNKLAAARLRRAWGYLFMGTGAEHPCNRVLVQAAIELAYVAAVDPVSTRVSERSLPVLNHVMKPEHLLAPEVFVERLRAARRGNEE